MFVTFKYFLMPLLNLLPVPLCMFPTSNSLIYFMCFLEFYINGTTHYALFLI